MRTIHIDAYKFEELSKDVQKEVVYDHRNINADNFEWHASHVKEDFEIILGHMGFRDIQIFYSGFGSQGDGACFEGRFDYDCIDLKKLKAYCPKDKEILLIAKRIKEIVKRNKGFTARLEHARRYFHSRTVSYDIFRKYDYTTTNCDEYDVDKGDADHFEYLCRELMELIYKRLEEEYEYLMSDEVVIATISDNDLEFFKDGRLIKT